MTPQPAPPWSTAPALLRNEDGAWHPVSERTLASDHTPASLMLVLGRIAGIRPPLGQSLFADVLHRTPGTTLTGDTITPLPREGYDSGTRSLASAEQVLADALRRHGVRGAVRPARPVDHTVTQYLTEITSPQTAAPSQEQDAAVAVDARGIRDLLGAVQAESTQEADEASLPSRLLRGLLGREGRRSSQPAPSPEEPPAEPEDPDPEPDDLGDLDDGLDDSLDDGLDLDPQWLTAEAIQMIDVARIVSLTSWREAFAGLPARVSQLLWTAAEDVPTGPPAAYRPAHDPEVLTAFSQVPYQQRAATLPNGIRTHDAALCRRYGRDPVDDYAAARLQAVREASRSWSAWQEELAGGSLAAHGCIDVKGMADIGKDPFLRQKHALSIKKTVETERWVTSWLDAGGLLTEQP